MLSALLQAPYSRRSGTSRVSRVRLAKAIRDLNPSDAGQARGHDSVPDVCLCEVLRQPQDSVPPEIETYETQSGSCRNSTRERNALFNPRPYNGHSTQSGTAAFNPGAYHAPIKSAFTADLIPDIHIIRIHQLHFFIRLQTYFPDQIMPCVYFL